MTIGIFQRSGEGPVKMVTVIWTRFLDLRDLQDHGNLLNHLIVFSNIGIVVEDGGDRILSVS